MMLILTGKRPKKGEMYVTGTQIHVSLLENVESFPEPNSSVDLLTPGPEVLGGEKLLLLEKDLLESDLLNNKMLYSDYLIYKFFLLSRQQIVYWKAAPIILPNQSIEDGVRRGEHNFTFNFVRLEDYVTFQLKKGQ